MTAPRVRPPAPLPPRLRELMAEYRQADRIPPDVEERIWSVVGSEQDFAAVDGEPPDVLAPEGSRRSPRVLVGWLGFGVAAAAVLALAWHLGGRRAERSRPGASPDTAIMLGTAKSSSSTARAAPASSRPEGARAAQAVEIPNEPPAGPATQAVPTVAPKAADPARARAGAGPPRDAQGRAPSPRASDLGAERELVARAWRSLAHGDASAALVTTAEHRRRFEAGLLAPEREAIEVIARCRRGDADGPRRAAAFHRAHPSSPLAERVDEACDGLTAAPAGP
ncbi:MAG: hypothetical protein AB1Z98_00880 [Nannocystaceae bacterium]